MVAKYSEEEEQGGGETISFESLMALIRKAKSGDESAHRKLTSQESTDALFEPTSALAEEAESAWLDLLAGNKPETRRELVRRLREHEQMLLSGSNHPLLRTLARRIALLALQVDWGDRQIALLGAMGPDSPSIPFRRREIIQLHASVHRSLVATARLFGNTLSLLGQSRRSPAKSCFRVKTSKTPRSRPKA